MSKRHAVYQVTFLTGVAPGKKKVQAEEVILGRVEGCTLVVEHKDVSRRHLSIKMMYGQVVIEDLGSSNGTFLNGNELNPKTPTVVGPNDVISLGRHVQISIEAEMSDVSPPPTQDKPQATVVARVSTTTQAQPKTQAAIKQESQAPVPQASKRAVPPPPSGYTPPPAEDSVVEEDPRPEKKAVRPGTFSSNLELEKPKFDFDSPLPRAIKQNERLHQELIEARAEAKRTIAAAQKQAASIVQEAERLAEVKTQGFYERARKAEAEANELYRTRTEEALRDAAKAFEESRLEAQAISDEAREKAQEVREQAEQFAAELQADAQRKMHELLRSGEQQARELVARKSKEAEDVLERREKELVEKILSDLKDETDQKRVKLQKELDQLEREAVARVAVTEARNRELVQASLDGKIKAEEMRKELERANKELENRRRDVAYAKVELDSVKSNLQGAITELDKAKLEASTIRSSFQGTKDELDRQLEASKRELNSWLEDKAREQQKWIATNDAKLAEALAETDKLLLEATQRYTRFKEQSETEQREWLARNEKERSEWVEKNEKERFEFNARSEKERNEWVSKTAQERADWITKHEKEKKEWLEAYQAEQTKLLSESESKRKEIVSANERQIAETSLRLAQLKKEVETFMLEKSRLSGEVDNATNTSASTLREIKAKFDAEKARVEREEQNRLDQMKLETGRQVQKLEQDMLLEIQQNKVRLAREIGLVISTALSGRMNTSQIVEIQDVLQVQIAQVLQSPSSISTSATGATTQVTLDRARRRNQFRQMSTGFTMGIAFMALAGLAYMYTKGNLRPVDRMVANAVDERNADLQARKFNPPQVAELKDNYTDDVIYTRGFTQLYTDEAFQIEYGKAVAQHMLKTFVLDEDKTIQVTSRLAALVKTLAERKEKIHPDFVQKGVGQMRDLEAQTMKEVAKDLGSQVRLEALQKFERDFVQSRLK